MSKVSNAASEDGEAQRRARVREAALTVFARYGLKRTAMADLAAAAGMSRPALYLLYPNKHAVFADVAVSLLEACYAEAEAAWPPAAPLAGALAGALLAKDLALFRLLAASPHGAEILSEGMVLTLEAHAAIAGRFHALLVSRFAAAGCTAPDALARMVTKAADGLKHAGGSEADYIADVHRLAALVAAAAGG